MSLVDTSRNVESLEAVRGRTLDRCARLARITDEPGIICRGFLSPAMQEVNTVVAGWMQEAGLETEVDGVGNLIGCRPGADPGAPVLVLGSHLDTVRDAGAYDGVLGVLLAVALCEMLGDRPLPFDIEVVAFSDEEGLRFGVPFLGSKGLTGELEPDLLTRRDDSGVSVAEAIAAWGGESAGKHSRYEGRQVLGFVEAHIEQGPCLEHRDLSLGIVRAISDARWLSLCFDGRAGHAGTVPTALRRDPVPAAAEAVLAAERLARNEEELVATVGQITPRPGASNVIAGSVEMSVDMRHPDGVHLDAAVDALLEACAEVAGRRGLGFRHQTLNRQYGAKADPELSRLLAEAVVETGHEPGYLTIGAGHDALVMSRIAPMAMLLLRSPGGISHHPDECVRHPDVDAALRALQAFVGRLAALAPHPCQTARPPIESSEDTVSAHLHKS